MAIAKENDLVSSICIVKILYREFLRYAFFFFFFCEMYFEFGCATHLELVIFYFKYKLHVAVSFGGNTA